MCWRPPASRWRTSRTAPPGGVGLDPLHPASGTSIRSSAGDDSYCDADQCCDADHLPRIVAYIDIGVPADLKRLGTHLCRAVGERALGRRKCDFHLRLDAGYFRCLHIAQRISQILDVFYEAADLAVGEFSCTANVAAI